MPISERANEKKLGGFMRRFILSLFILFTLAACGNNNDPALPVPTSPDAEMSGESAAVAQPTQTPVILPTATPSLPPTFTPDPMAHQGHLYLLPVSGADGRIQYVHVVRPGDTLTGLSRLYGIPLDAVAQANSIQDQDLIRVGTQLIIPISGD
jgi:LysM repeat protein